MDIEKIKKIVQNIKKENLSPVEKEEIIKYLLNDIRNSKIMFQDSFAVKSSNCPYCGRKL